MPILNADKARTVIINKRTMNIWFCQFKTNCLDMIIPSWYLAMQKIC